MGKNVNYIVSEAQLAAIAEITRYKAMLKDQMLVKEIPAYIAGIAGGGTSYVLGGNIGFSADIAVFNKNEGTEDESIEQINGIFATPINIVNRNDFLIGNFEVVNE